MNEKEENEILLEKTEIKNQQKKMCESLLNISFPNLNSVINVPLLFSQNQIQHPKQKNRLFSLLLHKGKLNTTKSPFLLLEKEKHM